MIHKWKVVKEPGKARHRFCENCFINQRSVSTGDGRYLWRPKAGKCRDVDIDVDIIYAQVTELLLVIEPAVDALRSLLGISEEE